MPGEVTLGDRVVFGTVAAKEVGEAIDGVTDGAPVVIFTTGGFSHVTLMTDATSPATPRPTLAIQTHPTCRRGFGRVRDLDGLDGIVVNSAALGSIEIVVLQVLRALRRQLQRKAAIRQLIQPDSRRDGDGAGEPAAFAPRLGCGRRLRTKIPTGFHEPIEDLIGLEYPDQAKLLDAESEAGTPR